MNSKVKDIRIFVAIDFGTTYSSFAYVHKENTGDVVVNDSWPGREGALKTPTVLLYNKGYKEVITWGHSALEEDPDEVLDDIEERLRPVELFKLYLSNLQEEDKPWLPSQLNYDKAIEDYLTQMRKLIEETLERRWPTVKFPQQVNFTITIPAEWPPNTTKIMRECAYKAGLLTSLNSSQLEFTTEPEAAALHCLNVVKEHNLQPGDSFLVADCGGGTVDLTSRKLLSGNRLSEITERVGEICGSTFVDKGFLQWLGRKLGIRALEQLRSKNYGQMQYLVQRFFCTRIKFKFTGEQKDFKLIKLNLQHYFHDLPQYVTGEHKEQMEEEEWILRVDFQSVKEMFDPVINRIIKLIGDQLNASDEKCSAMFLVGGFSESPYLLRKVKETFKHRVPIISVPSLPIAAIVRGAIAYGLDIDTIHDRMLKWTYGIQICRKWVDGKDDISRRTSDGYIFTFHKLPLAQRGKNFKVDQKFVEEFVPLRKRQSISTFKVFYTPQHNATFCDERGMKLLGILKIKTDDTHLNSNHPIEFSLTFGKMEIKAAAKNKVTGKFYKETTFELDT